jgi:hypothetical protein
MPEPIRPLGFLGEHGDHEGHVPDDSHSSDTKVNDICIAAMEEEACYESRADNEEEPSTEIQADHSDCIVGCEVMEDVNVLDASAHLGLPLNLDPFGRDTHEVKSEWSVEPLAKYLKRVSIRIDSNIRNHRQPTVEKLDAFVSSLVSTTHRHLRRAPKKVRQPLTGLCTRRFHRFWDFARNQKLRATTPDELRSTLVCLTEALLAEFTAWPSCDQVKQALLAEFTVRPPNRPSGQIKQRAPMKRQP